MVVGSLPLMFPLSQAAVHAWRQSVIRGTLRGPHDACRLAPVRHMGDISYPGESNKSKERRPSDVSGLSEKLGKKTLEEIEERQRQRQSLPDNARAAKEEHDGPKGVEPTRYGDWERKGRVSDF
eukprot:6193649-Pleurochrysis_carterae.AAC.1